jgi:hypothetical protein
MSVNKSKNKEKDPRTQAIENNPCGRCRAMGFPTCKGHGSGSGGEGDEASEASELTNTDTLTLDTIISKSELWHAEPNADDVYIYNALDALVSIKLDLAAGSLVFSKKGPLSKEEQKALDEFFDTIEHELNAFKKELEAQGVDTQSFQSHREKNCLTIQIPGIQHYDAFVQRLMDKNLLPTALNQEQTKHNVAAATHQDNQKEPEASSSAPNPFDISKGP